MGARVLGLDYVPYAEVSGHFALQFFKGSAHLALRATLRPLHRVAQSGEHLFTTGSRYMRIRGRAEWKAGDRLRHSRFAGLREDKDPRTVVKEQPGEA